MLRRPSFVTSSLVALTVSASALAQLGPVDPAAARPGKTFKGPGAIVSSVSHSGSSGMIAAGYFNSTVQIWNVNSGQAVELKGHDNWITAVAWSPSGPLLASAGLDKKIILWQLPTKKPTRVIDGAAAPAAGQPAITDKHLDWIRTLAFTPDGKFLISGGDDNAILVWEVETGKFVRRLDGSSNWVMALAVSPDGKQLAAGGFDKMIRIWDLAAGTKVKDIPANNQYVLALGWSPDGKLIASGGQDKVVRLWDAESGKEVRALTGHTDLISAVAFHPNGQILASCSGDLDKSVRLWSVADGKELKNLSGHSKGVYGLSFTADGSALATAGADETVRLWELTPQRPGATANGQSPK
jgi:WD40 repeat protein